MGIPAYSPPVPPPWANPNLTQEEKARWADYFAKNPRSSGSCSRRSRSDDSGSGSFLWGLFFGSML